MGNRGEKKRKRLTASTVTSKISNIVTFTNQILSAHILHKAKIQHYFINLVITRK